MPDTKRTPTAKTVWAYAYQIVPPQPAARLHSIKTLLDHAHTEAQRDARTWTIYVERAHPHRIVKWTTSAGEQAELLGAERVTYWQMNGPGFESALSKLGMQPRPPRTP